MSERTIANVKEIAKIFLVLAFIAFTVAPGISYFLTAPDFSHDE